ncbi:MAG: hypothetical protein AAFR56_07660 [Chloroflexota bacterium]
MMIMDSTAVIAFTTMIIAGVWLFINYRRSRAVEGGGGKRAGSGGKAPTGGTPMVQAARKLGITATSKRASGKYRDHKIRIEKLPPRNDQPGITVYVTAKSPLKGDLRFSGPSENASSGTPEVKITTGNGNFDYHYWIIKSEPKELAGVFISAHSDLAEKLVSDAPFGIWRVRSKAVSYRGFNIDSAPVATDPDYMVKIADALVDIAEALAD